MKSLRNTRHSAYFINYHIVWITKDRREILTGEIALLVEESLKYVAREKEWDIIALSVIPGHIDLVVSAPPKFAPSEIVKAFKGFSARRVLMAYPELGQKGKRGTLWAPSYYVGAVGNVPVEEIQHFIETCQDH